MQELRLEDFDGAIGESWEVEAGERSLPLRLLVAQALPRAMRPEGSFRLEWLGPTDLLLPQGIYPFRRDGGTAEIFIVPIAQTPDGYRYEAVFN